MSGPRRVLAVLALTLACVASGCGGKSTDWPLPNHDLASTRFAARSGITRANVSRLHLLWRIRLRAKTDSGAITATPLIAGGVVYVQDMKSNVLAVRARDGRLLWRHHFTATSPGPNGLALADGRVYGATDSTAFALASADGRTLWTRRLVDQRARFVDIAPQVAHNDVFVSTIGLPPNGRGVLFALNEATGRVVWRRSTIKSRFAVPEEAGGGGAWYTPSVDDADVYWGIANPYPYGGSRRHPNGGAYAGPALYTDSLLVTDLGTGSVAWYAQITPHDVRDYDFQLPPILTHFGSRAVVISAGKAGRVLAWDARTHARLWERRVGLHRNDAGPLPARRIRVCPGLFGGVETPMALAGTRLFVPVVDLCAFGSATGYQPIGGLDPSTGTGELVALAAQTGAVLWVRRLAKPDFGCATAAGDVVFTSTFDGTLLALDARTGATLWQTRLPAGINACPAVSGRTVVVGAGVGPGAAVEAFGL